MNRGILFTLLTSSFALGAFAAIPEPKFREVEIDRAIQIGYGVAVADVDGDHKPDILLADKTQFVWYRNPNWDKHVLAENLTKLDNVCIAAEDIDSDGKAEVAVGAGWNPNDTTGSGALFYLVPPQDRSSRWEAVPLPHVPTIHRIRWMERANGYELISVPLHGYGNKNGEGEGVPIYAYQKPRDPRQPWTTNLLAKQWHKTHNFDVHGPEMLVAAKEGVFQINARSSATQPEATLIATNGVGGFGEVRQARAARFIAAIEPMHGTNVALLTPTSNGALYQRRVLDATLVDGHALACGDLLGIGREQIIAGWRAMGAKDAKVGIKVYTPLDAGLKEWRTTLVDDNKMACEDLCLADLNGDGKLDIIAAGRGTKNVKIYFNESP